MLYFVIGLPGRFTEWCDAATVAITRRVLGPTELVRADALEEISLAMIRTGASRAVVASRQPGGRLRSALVAAGRTFLVVVEDPRTAFVEAVHRQRNDVAAAAQLVASSCAGITRYVSSPGALALFRDRDGSDPATAARAIAHHLALNVSDADLVEIISDLAAADLTFERSDGAVQWDGLGVEEQRVVGGAIGPFVTYLATGKLPPIIWERELFFLGDRPSERATGHHRRHRTGTPSIGWAPYNAAAGILVAVAETALFARDYRARFSGGGGRRPAGCFPHHPAAG
jgi:hypothetical protein